LKFAVNIIRWITRITGSLLFLFFIWFAYEFGGPSFNCMSVQEFKLFIANIIMLIGLIIVWKFEFLGSITLISSYVFFSIVNNSFWIGPAFGTFIFIGIIHLLCWGYTVLSNKDKSYSKIKYILK